MSSENERSLRDELAANLEEVQDRVRDEAGRFASKQVDEPASVEVEAVEEQPAKDAVAATEVKTEPKDEDAFPSSWKKEVAAHWANVPPELKKYIRQHEEQTRQAMTKQDEDRLTGKSMREVINPYLPMIQAEGATMQTAVQSLLNQAYILRRGTPEQKRQLVMAAVKQYGIDVTEPTSSNPGWVDPQVAALQQELADLKGWRSQFEQQAQYQETASINTQIQSFASDPKHEHFSNPQVQSMMGNLMMGNQAQDLEDAYQKAIWAIPELRSTLLTSQAAELEAKRAAEAKAKATAARNASGSVRGSSSGLSTSTVSAPKGTLREEIAAAMRAAKDR
jgi:hypothetical protein